MKLIKYLFLFSIALCLSCSDDDDDSPQPQNTFTDVRDGTVYGIVTIGNQVWFSENLRFNQGDNSYDCYDSNETNCFIYGGYYTGDAALISCPDGWHLPSVEEWQELVDNVGGEIAAGQLLKPYAMLQGEEVGFNLLEGGYSFGGWTKMDEQGYYYTSTDTQLQNSLKYFAYIQDVATSLSGTVSKGIKMNCRCIKD